MFHVLAGVSTAAPRFEIAGYTRLFKFLRPVYILETEAAGVVKNLLAVSRLQLARANPRNSNHGAVPRPRIPPRGALVHNIAGRDRSIHPRLIQFSDSHGYP
jgi:hypothetical protein